MPTYRGFNTIHQHKKFGITDFELIKRDLLNAFLIREGEMPGRPDLGSNIWSYVFEPNTNAVRTELQDEVEKVVGLDPRLELSSINISFDLNTVIIEVALLVKPSFSVEKLSLVFEKESQNLYIT